jgi:hypothetical protein
MPSYPVSRAYVTNINVTNTRVETTVVNNYYTTVVVNKQVNVTNVTYVNQHVNGAVTATSGASFTSGQSVSRNVVHVDQREIVSAQVAAPAIPPTRQAFVGAGAVSNVRPPAALANRAVVAKTSPPPPPVSFDRQQAAIRANGGRPIAAAQYRQLQPANTQAAARPNVRIAPVVHTVTPIPPHSNVAARPVQPNNSVNANRPNVPNNAGNAPARTYSDRPQGARPNVNANLEQQHQQQLENLRKQQDLERQKVEQQQVKEQQKVQTQNDQQKQLQVQQKQQQQLEDLEKKHDTQQKQLQQKQAVEKQNNKPPANSDKDKKPPKSNR